LIPCEFACAWLAYYTDGEVMSGRYMTLVAMNLFAVSALVISPRAAVIGLLLLAVLIIPYQGLLGARWWRAHREAQQIIAWATAAKGQAGSYPANLQGYTFRDRAVGSLFSYQPLNSGQSFDLGYSVGSPGTMHTYTPESDWYYYPD
jgi:hypothetical protein